jgi:hypothetical protein
MTMKGQSKHLVVIAMALLLVVAGCSPSPAALPPKPIPPTPSQVQPPTMTVAFEGGKCTYAGPKVIQPGEINVTMDIKDLDKQVYALYLLTLDQGKTINDLDAWPSTDKPTWAQIVNGSESGFSGQRNTFAVTVQKGPIYLACFSSPPEAKIGALGPIEVGK